MSWSFDADVLIYAAAPGHELGEGVWQLLQEDTERGFGSVLLIPEFLIRPVGSNASLEVDALTAVLARLELIETTAPISSLAVELGAAYGLKAADAVHLASAVWVGADAFLTNNHKDFKPELIRELRVVFPSELTTG